MRTPFASIAPLLARVLVTALVPLAARAEITNDPLLGPGLRLRPAYDGSASQRLEGVPVVRIFGPPLFVRSTQGVLEAGLRMPLGPGLHGGLQVAYEPGRQASESDFLLSHQVVSVAPGASLGAQLEWDLRLGPMPVTALMRLRKHTDAQRGAQADFRLSAGVFQGGGIGAGVFTQAVWADARSTSTLYGLDTTQAALSGLPAFAPGSGWLNASAGLLWSVDLAPQWVVVGSLEARWLHGDAARSPLVEQSASHYLSAGLAYRF